jgi:membrane protease YdiL (CAAX protease family)
MNPVTLELLLYSSLLTLLLAAIVGILWAWIWALRHIWAGRGLLENVRPSTLGEPSWGALTVFAVVLLYILVNLSVTRGYAVMTGRRLPRAENAAEKKAETEKPDTELKKKLDRREAPLGAVVGGAKREVDHDPGTPAGGPEETVEQTEAELLIQLAIVNILLLILVPALVALTSNASLADLGLDFKNWKAQMAVGAVAALLMTPAVLAIQSLAVRIWPPHKHPVEDMILEEFTAGRAILAVLSAMILAPLIEELLFRAIVQRWLTKLFCGRRDLAGSLAEPNLIDELADGWPAENSPFQPPGGTDIEPAAKRSPATGTPAFSVTAIVVTSLLFSAMHLPQWPAPIGIFLLAMALGAVYQKTGSLISAVTMHGVFNGFSTVGLLLMALDRQLQPHHVGAAHALIPDVFAIMRVAIGLSG